MPRSWRHRVEDILEAIERVASYLDGMDEDSFAADTRTVQAVAYNLLVIGEAAAGLPDEVCENHPAVPWHHMRGTRNFIAHQYFDVDPSILWQTVTHDLPPLVHLLRGMLPDSSEDHGG